MYLNARSIKSKLNELEILARENNPDLILVTESWCSSEITNSELSIENYFIDPSLRQDRKDTSNGIGGGLLVYVNKTKSIGVSEANYSCIWFLNGGIINSD